MALTQALNERLTGVGPGTPGGELLRRYWHPVAMLSALSDESPTEFVRILGEDLVLFRDKSGDVGLIQDHCAHRGASLLYGRVEERGISCAYHGWLYDTEGRCLETPAEPADSKLHLTVRIRAYPVQALGGLYWAYLGPLPAPALPRYDVLVRCRIADVQEIRSLDANWVQVVENNLDGTHIGVLHRDVMRQPRPGGKVVGGAAKSLDLDYREVPLGIMRRMVSSEGYVEEDPLLFPYTLRRMNQLVCNVPVDDTHTMLFYVFVDLGEGSRDGGEGDGTTYWELRREDIFWPALGADGQGRYRMDRLRLQDYMALETQGLVSPRGSWRLGTSDKGIDFFDRLLLREIDKVERGEEPIGVIPDPGDAYVDTNLDETLRKGARPSMPEGDVVAPTFKRWDAAPAPVSTALSS
jgi:5,5'-dehydrodivanillate O-demethylase oxygenase subunit